VQPVCLKYPFDHVDPSWHISLSMGACLLKLMVQITNHLEATILEPYIPSREEIEKPSLYANNVRDKMSKVLQIPMTEHSYEDVLLMYQAEKLHMPVDKVNIELSSIKQLYKIDLEKAKELLKKFATEDPDHKGTLTIDDFARMLGLPITDRIVSFFQSFDKNGDGTIDFKEFLEGLTILNQTEESNEIIDDSFKIFDEKGKGYIDLPSFKIVLKRNYESISNGDMEKLFNSVAQSDNQRGITYDEYVNYAKTHPEYLFLIDQALKIRREKEEKERLQKI